MSRLASSRTRVVGLIIDHNYENDVAIAKLLDAYLIAKDPDHRMPALVRTVTDSNVDAVLCFCNPLQISVSESDDLHATVSGCDEVIYFSTSSSYKHVESECDWAGVPFTLVRVNSTLML